MMERPALDPRPPLKPMTITKESYSILVVEDDEWIRRVLCVTLKNHGYGCVEASNGLEGLEQLTRHAVDIVITDLQMPMMSGGEFIRILQNRYERLAPPVILVSGLHRSVLPNHLKQLNISAIFQKPYPMKELLQSVDSLTRRTGEDDDR